MRAVVYRKFGGPEVLETVQDQPLPPRKSGEILIKIYSAGCNPLDCKFRDGSIPIAAYNKVRSMARFDSCRPMGYITNFCKLSDPGRRYCWSSGSSRPDVKGQFAYPCEREQKAAHLLVRPAHNFLLRSSREGTESSVKVPLQDYEIDGVRPSKLEHISSSFRAHKDQLVPAGAYAEYASVPQDLVVIIPHNLSFDEAAALPLVCLTSLQVRTSYFTLWCHEWMLQ